MLPPKNDLVFRLLFGDVGSKNILSGLLNSILDMPDDEFEILSIADPHLLPDYDGDKLGILDIKIKTRSGHYLNVEMQVNLVKGLESRIEFYNAKMLVEQMKSSDEYSTIKRSISILILNNIMFPKSNSYHHCFERYDIKNKVPFPGVTEIHTLELPKLPNNSDDTVLWEWMYFLSAEKEEDFKMIAEKNNVIKEAVMKLEVLSKDERARLLYESMEKKRRDDIAREAYIKEQGMQRGMQRGLQKGILDSIINVMDSLDLPPDQAMDILKISDDTKPEYEKMIKESKATYDVDSKD